MHLSEQWAAKGLWSLTSLQSELGASSLTGGREIAHRPRPEAAEAATNSPAQAEWRSPLARPSTAHISNLWDLKKEKDLSCRAHRHVVLISNASQSPQRKKVKKKKKLTFITLPQNPLHCLVRLNLPAHRNKERKAVFVESQAEPRETWIRIITENQSLPLFFVCWIQAMWIPQSTLKDEMWEVTWLNALLSPS